MKERGIPVNIQMFIPWEHFLTPEMRQKFKHGELKLEYRWTLHPRTWYVIRVPFADERPYIVGAVYK